MPDGVDTGPVAAARQREVALLPKRLGRCAASYPEPEMQSHTTILAGPFVHKNRHVK